MLIHDQMKKNNLTKLLISLVVIYFLVPFSTSVIGNYFVALLFLIANLLIVNLLSLSKTGEYILRFLAIVACILDLSHAIQILDLTRIALLANFFYAIFSLLAIVSLIRMIYKKNKVDLNTLNGGIAIFLLLAFIWFNFYAIILTLDPNAFRGLSTETERQYQIFYYSFTTITTLGYGDIIPLNKYALSLANAEAIIGLLYPAIFIARLVGLYTTQEEESL